MGVVGKRTVLPRVNVMVMHMSWVKREVKDKGEQP